MIASLREIPHALGGDVAGGQVLAPGPGHGPRDRSLSIKLSTTSPDSSIRTLSPAMIGSNVATTFAPPLGSSRKAVEAVRARTLLRDTRRPRGQSATTPAALRAPSKFGAKAAHPGETPIEPYLESRGLALDSDFMLERGPLE